MTARGGWSNEVRVRSPVHAPFAKADVLALAVIVLLGLAPRIAHLAYPMQYDESYTFMVFARPSLFTAVTDYHLPNNHVLHSVLVHLSTRLFGEAPWAVRLPAFLAGVACIPLAYLLALRHYGRTAALIAASFMAAWPRPIDYSADARGYSLVMAFTLGLYLIGGVLLRRDSKPGWAALVLLASAGLFTIPVMAYPISALIVWLALSFLAGVTREGYPRGVFLTRLVMSGLGIAVLTLALYSPILIVSGPEALFANSFVRSNSWADYLQSLPDWLSMLWGEWRWHMPGWMGAGVMLLALLGTALHRRVSGLKIPPQVGVGLLILPVVLLQRPEPNPRPWLFLAPLLLVWAGAGAAWLADQLRYRWTERLAVGIVLAIALWLGAAKFTRDWPFLAGEKGRLEQVGAYLAAHAEADDLYLVVFPVDPQIWYHLIRYGVENPTLKYKGKEYARAWAVVDEVTGQSLQQVLANREELPACSTMQEMQWVEQIERVQIYICTR